MNGTYVSNLETGKIELHFSKADYMALPDAQKGEIKSRFLFSGRLGCWVSRSTNSHYWPLEVASKLGLANGGETGERLTFTERQEQKVEQAEARTERMLEHAHKAEARAADAYERADLSEGKSGIPFGQPILVGHHSERRHRRAIERADRAMSKAVEETNKAKYFKGRALAAESTAAQSGLQDKRFLQNRIGENEKELRRIDRRLANAAAWTCTPEEATEYKRKLEAWRIEIRERLDFFTGKMNELGGVAYNKSNIKPGDAVKIRGRWEKVVKANNKTVSTTTPYFPWPLKYPYAEIQEHKSNTVTE